MIACLLKNFLFRLIANVDFTVLCLKSIKASTIRILRLIWNRLLEGLLKRCLLVPRCRTYISSKTSRRFFQVYRGQICSLFLCFFYAFFVCFLDFFFPCFPFLYCDKCHLWVLMRFYKKNKQTSTGCRTLAAFLNKVLPLLCSSAVAFLPKDLRPSPLQFASRGKSCHEELLAELCKCL